MKPSSLPWTRFLNVFVAFFLFGNGNSSAQCLINPSSLITTIAGIGTTGYSGDNGPATSAKLDHPYGLCLDPTGNIYFCDDINRVIRKIDTTGIITTVAGNGTFGYAGDGGPATSAELKDPTFLAFDSAGNLYIADGAANV